VTQSNEVEIVEIAQFMNLSFCYIMFLQVPRPRYVSSTVDLTGGDLLLQGKVAIRAGLAEVARNFACKKHRCSDLGGSPGWKCLVLIAATSSGSMCNEILSVDNFYDTIRS